MNMSRGFQQAARSPEDINLFWPGGYLSGGYFDDHDNLKIKYVSRENVEPFVKAMCKSQYGPLTSHQIRRYFGHCRTIETRLKSDERLWPSVLQDIKKLDMAAADGIAKRPSKIPQLFHDFILRNVAMIKTKHDFLGGFLPHFEALVGFGAAHFRKERT